MKNSRILPIGGAILALTVAYSVVRFTALPDHVPMHFNAAGQVDRFGSKLEAVLFGPILLALLLAMFVLVPKYLSKEQKFPAFLKAWDTIGIAVLGFISVVQYMILKPGVGTNGSGQVKILMVGMSLLFIILGNLMGKTERNPVMGIRTKWTLASDENWHRTHRLGGQLMVGGGLLCLIMALLGVNVLIITAVILAATLYPVWYSYRLSRRLNP